MLAEGKKTMSSLQFTTAVQLIKRLEENGFDPGYLDKLGKFGNLAGFRNVLDGLAEIKMIEHLVNCNETPFIPDGWSILPEEEQLPNRIRGLYKLDITKVKLHLVKEQTRGSVGGNELRKKLKGEPVLPANILDFLLKKENQHLIPQEWKGKAIFFWGTIYRHFEGHPLVRCLCSSGGEWDWRDAWAGGFWFDNPSASAS